MSYSPKIDTAYNSTEERWGHRLWEPVKSPLKAAAACCTFAELTSFSSRQGYSVGKRQDWVSTVSKMHPCAHTDTRWPPSYSNLPTTIRTHAETFEMLSLEHVSLVGQHNLNKLCRRCCCHFWIYGSRVFPATQIFLPPLESGAYRWANQPQPGLTCT